ncbi:hypothetical protein [Sphingomonas japonica]|uniref:Lipoprotein n=1 Tax=Sphingomonas japonica TaxID=511662 RepID=A0ABX0U4K0_9SPHN|nr:hypothetical protein [Sphingomonas japonica]NIJ23688.1 hypothetical protein [Sphingomonas japonica]
MIRIAVPMLLILAGCATSAERTAQQEQRSARDAAELADQLDGLVASDTRNCLDTQTRSFATDVVGPNILYRESRARIWVTRTSGDCSAGGRDPVLVTRSFAGQLCRGDIIRSVDRSGGMLVGSCAAGEFTLYKRPEGNET